MTENRPRSQRLVSLFRDTLDALDPGPRVERALVELEFSPNAAVVVAIGKAAGAMLDAALAYMERERVPLSRGVLAVPAAGPGRVVRRRASSAVSILGGGHPVPDRRSVAAARAALTAVAGAGPNGAEVLCLISGGGSALAALPTADLTLADKLAAIRAVADSGASITQLNTVRKHLSAIKGGQLARASTAPVTTLVVSDVVGDDPATVASGPTLPDPTTHADAFDIVARASGWRGIPDSVRDHLERGRRGQLPDTPDRARPGDVARVIAGTDALVHAARDACAQADLDACILGRGVTADVMRVADMLDREIRRLCAGTRSRPVCLLSGGEPTIALPSGHGTGGRAQQLALLVARAMAGSRGVSVLCAGSDGIDGNSDAAGAIVDGTTWHALSAAGVDGDRALRACDASTALGRVGACVRTGATGVNHADIIMILADP